MNSLFIRDLIIYGVLLVFILFITKQQNMWGLKRGTSKTKIDVKKAKDIAKYRNRLIAILKKCEVIGKTFGWVPNITVVEQYKFNIARGHLFLPYVERNISAYELIGLFKVIKFVGCFLAVILTVLTGNRLFLLLISVVFVNALFSFVMDYKILDEDKEIEEDFPDLFLLLYSRLLRGTAGRLSPTLNDYLKSLDVVYGENSHKAMHFFVTELRKNIELFGDDSMALNKMREMYKSAMLVNFFNLAVQSLRGVDNKDKLVAFKFELSQKKLNSMTEKANLRIEKGQKVVMLIFVILAQFVILSWIAKAGLSLG